MWNMGRALVLGSVKSLGAYLYHYASRAFCDVCVSPIRMTLKSLHYNLCF